MDFLLKDTIHRSLAETVYNDILTRRSNYYYFIGKIIDWPNVIEPEEPVDTYAYEYETRNSIISAKRVVIRDVSLVIPRVDWTPSTVYDQYDNNYSADHLAASGATKLEDANFYVMASNFSVYKCIFNNLGVASTVEPSGLDLTPVTYEDGYIWKYMYTIPLSNRNKFLTEDYMPVQRAITNTFYSNGEISSVVVDNGGSGYLGNAEVTLTVNGLFRSGNGNVSATLTPVLNDSGQIVNVVINTAGNNYSNASIVVTDNLSSGESYYKGVSAVTLYNFGTGYTTAVRSNTTAVITTTGNSLPGSNAILAPAYSNNNNTFVGISILNPGNGYTTAVKNNTTITISTTGASQPTVNATANISYTSGAVLTPVLTGGVIDRVLINDPGNNYSANNQTTIFITGDGTGGILVPSISAAGALEDVIIEERGSGYSYLNISVIGDGANANAFATLSIGDLDTQQGIVELSAVNGGIYNFSIINPGTNYTTANISIAGDGTGFIGNVVLNNSNTISYVTVASPGTGYSYANVTIGGNGANANLSAIFSPPGGHGFDAVKELFADTLMIYSTINNEKNQGIYINNDYRQFGIIKDPKKSNSNLSFTDTLGSACYLLTLNSVSGLEADQLFQITSANPYKEFDIVEVKSSTKQVLVTDRNSHEFLAGDILTYKPTDTQYTVSSVNAVPDINKFSGDLLFIDNRTTGSYSDKQVVTLRTVLRL